MANPHLGEVAFKAGADEFKLSYSANALVELEGALGIDLDALMAKFREGSVSLSMLRVMFWQGLLDHHEGLSLDDTKKILKNLLPNEMGELVGRAFALSMPKGDGAAASSPQQPGPLENGVGSAPSTTGSTSAEQKPTSGV